jgi:hypothetical protein
MLTAGTPKVLERTCKGIAALDAILCDDWESRYYSFNAQWNPEGTERLASMRNGEGDDWFIVFAPAGVFVKSLWHEYGAEAGIYDGLPDALAPFLDEAAFSMDDVTFGGWCDGAKWVLRGNAKPIADEVRILSGDPKAYATYVNSYFEREVPLEAVAHVLKGLPITPEFVKQLDAERDFAELTGELVQMKYGL